MEPEPSRSVPPQVPPKPFWPTRQEAQHTVWALLLVGFLLLVTLGPAVVLWPLSLLPDGDQGWLVALRIAIGLALVVGYQVWMVRAIRLARRIFSGRLSPAMETWLHTEEPQPTRPLAVLQAQLPLVACAGLGLAVWFGFLDLDLPLNKADSLPRKFRGLVAVAQWCRGHPRTVHASAGVVGVGSLLWLGVQMVTAHRLGSRARST